MNKTAPILLSVENIQDDRQTPIRLPQIDRLSWNKALILSVLLEAALCGCEN